MDKQKEENAEQITVKNKVMIISFNCDCGNTNPQKARMYDGALGYEAMVCTCCGRYYDHFGAHLPDEWSIKYIREENVTYTTDGKCSVFCGKIEIARAYVGEKGYAVSILQGMSREQTIKKIVKDCPEFAKANEIDENYHPALFKK